MNCNIPPTWFDCPECGELEEMRYTCGGALDGVVFRVIKTDDDDSKAGMRAEPLPEHEEYVKELHLSRNQARNTILGITADRCYCPNCGHNFNMDNIDRMPDESQYDVIKMVPNGKKIEHENPRVVWKYQLELTGNDQKIEIPAKATLLTVAWQNSPAMWFLVDKDQPKEIRTFRVVGTGHPVDFTGEFLGTCFVDQYVWHVFERNDK